MPKKASKYYKKTKIPVEIINILEKTKKKINFSKINRVLKITGQFAFVLFLILGTLEGFSAFEAHVINVTARICAYSETQTPGFWRNHTELYILPQHLGPNEDEYKINTIEDAVGIFDNGNADDMVDQLKSHLLAMKFNIAFFGVGEHEVEGEGTLNEIVVEADRLLMPGSEATREELEVMKSLLDELNNLEQARGCFASRGEFGLIKQMSDGIGVLLSPGDSVEIIIDEPIPQPYCGDGNLDEAEECDDGNIEDGDGCSAVCIIEQPESVPEPEPTTECEIDAQQSCSTALLGICAAGTQICNQEGFWAECVQDNASTTEVCNNQLDDDCNGLVDCEDEACIEDSACQSDFVPEPELTPEPFCGDGNLDESEECDDGNTEDGDGCSATCAIEQPEPEPEYCGDGIINDEEQCDQGESNSTECISEYGSSCSYCSTECVTIEVMGAYCGDNNLDEGEECDDGNNINEDGCSDACLIEQEPELPPEEPNNATTTE